MSKLEDSQALWSSRMLSVFRVVAGLVFLSAGTMKLFGYPASPVPMPPLDLISQVGVAGVLETFGGLAIVLGLFTRPIAFVLAGEMAVAYFQFHFPRSFFPTNNEGIPAVMYCFFFLYLAFAGAGVWSLDTVLTRSKQRENRARLRGRSPYRGTEPAVEATAGSAL